MRTWVKICGVTRVEDALAAFAAGADAIGINFWNASRRATSPARAKEIVAALPQGSLVFGVFVNTSRSAILRLVEEVGLTGVQLHGGQKAADATGFGLPTILAVAATSREAVVSAMAEREHALQEWQSGYRLLVDHGSGGGSGRTVDEAILEGVELGEVVLAGGLTPHNVAARVARFRPFGVDTAGGVESAPGIKDAGAIEDFVRAARSADAE